MTLAEKKDLSLRRMREALDRFGPETAVGWTGAKDSTVVLVLWRRILAEAIDMMMK